MTVAQPSTPANHFHLLRRQALGEMKRPLVVFTPKSMLRNKAATSAVEDFTEVKRFQSVINDPNYVDIDGNKVGDTDKVKTIMLVSGKLYWDLEKKREADGRDDIAIVRVEMLHPIPFNRLREAFEAYPNATQVRFVQDEPAFNRMVIEVQTDIMTERTKVFFPPFWIRSGFPAPLFCAVKFIRACPRFTAGISAAT